MNPTQQLATGLMAVLMIGTIVMMPASFNGGAAYRAAAIRQAGTVSARPVVHAELPHDQVRDLTYN